MSVGPSAIKLLSLPPLYPVSSIVLLNPLSRFINEMIKIKITALMGKRKIYNTTLDSELTDGLRILAAQLGERQNDFIEEAIKNLLK
jgi:hypothetical protein